MAIVIREKHNHGNPDFSGLLKYAHELPSEKIFVLVYEIEDTELYNQSDVYKKLEDYGHPLHKERIIIASPEASEIEEILGFGLDRSDTFKEIGTEPLGVYEIKVKKCKSINTFI